MNTACDSAEAISIMSHFVDANKSAVLQICVVWPPSAYAAVPSHQLHLENSQPRNAQEGSNLSIEEAAAAELLGQDAIISRRCVNRAFEQRRVAMHAAVIDDCDIRGKRKRVVEDPIDDAVLPIRFVDGRHDENDMDAVVRADGMVGAHLTGNGALVARAQGSIGFLQGVFILDDGHSILGLRYKLRSIATQRTCPQARHAAKSTIGSEPRLQHGRQTVQPCRRSVVTVCRAQDALPVSSALKNAHDDGVVIQNLVQPVADELPCDGDDRQEADRTLVSCEAAQEDVRWQLIAAINNESTVVGVLRRDLDEDQFLGQVA